MQTKIISKKKKEKVQREEKWKGKKKICRRKKEYTHTQ